MRGAPFGVTQRGSTLETRLIESSCKLHKGSPAVADSLGLGMTQDEALARK